MSTLLDYDDLCQRYGLSRRYVRDTLTKRPGFQAPASAWCVGEHQY